MIGYRMIMLLLLVFTLSKAAENNAPADQPALVLQPSSYVEFTGSTIVASSGTIAIDANFIVLGEGIFGHFDLVAYNDSGAVLLVTSSPDQTYRRDRGPNIKSIHLETGSAQPCTLVEVSFHETRLEPETGACKPK